MKVDANRWWKFREMLNNAGEIQRALNILNSNKDCKIIIDDNKFIIYSDVDIFEGEKYFWRSDEFPRWVGEFILKGRKLRSGLATPMARYYGYRVLDYLCPYRCLLVSTIIDNGNDFTDYEFIRVAYSLDEDPRAFEWCVKNINRYKEFTEKKEKGYIIDGKKYYFSFYDDQDEIRYFDLDETSFFKVPW